MSIRIGILGYGNLGRGVECAIKHNPDLELVAVKCCLQHEVDAGCRNPDLSRGA